MPATQFIVYVTDITRSTELYRALLGLDPDFVTPGFVTFPLDEQVKLSLWIGGETVPTPDLPRVSEVCLTLTGGRAAIEAHLDAWAELDVAVVEPLRDAVFGPTFVVADPDGNRIRVAPVD